MSFMEEIILHTKEYQEFKKIFIDLNYEYEDNLGLINLCSKISFISTLVALIAIFYLVFNSYKDDIWITTVIMSIAIVLWLAKNRFLAMSIRFFLIFPLVREEVKKYHSDFNSNIFEFMDVVLKANNFETIPKFGYYLSPMFNGWITFFIWILDVFIIAIIAIHLEYYEYSVIIPLSIAVLSFYVIFHYERKIRKSIEIPFINLHFRISMEKWSQDKK